MAASTSSRSNLSGRHTSSPKIAKPLKGITMPVISLSQPHDRVVEMISKPCREWGFFLLVDDKNPAKYSTKTFAEFWHREFKAPAVKAFIEQL
ncbi:hypothetical protein LguiB_009908 [Lonicera macranthoides]